jgi:hypothetical protein
MSQFYEYTVTDRPTELEYTFRSRSELSNAEIRNRINKENINAIEAMESGDYAYIGNVAQRKKNDENRELSLQKYTAMAMGVPVSQVDVTSGGKDGFWHNFLQKVNLSWRLSPEMKLNELKKEYGKDSVKAIMVDGKPRFIFDGVKDGKRYVRYIDEEGFTASDFGDAASLVAQGVFVVGATLLAPKLAPAIAVGLRTPAGQAVATIGSNLFFTGVRDGVAKIRDNVITGKDFLQDVGEYTAFGNQKIQESLMMAVADYGLLKTGRFMAGFTRNSSSKYTEELLATYKDFNNKFGAELGKLKTTSGVRRGEKALEADLKAQINSPSVQGILQQNKEIIERGVATLQGSGKPNVEAIIASVSNNLRSNYDDIINKLAGADDQLRVALQQNLDLELAKAAGIRFDVLEKGSRVQKIIDDAFIASKTRQSNAYDAVAIQAKRDGIDFSVQEIVRVLQKSIEQIRGQSTSKLNKRILKQFNPMLGTKFEKLDDLLALANSRTNTKRITWEQLDGYIKNIGEDAVFTPLIGKTTLNRLAELQDGALRALRNNKVINPLTGRSKNKTGTFLNKANAEYKKYLRFQDLDSLFYKLAQREKSHSPQHLAYALGSRSALEKLNNPDAISRLMKVLPDEASRNEALQILRQNYVRSITNDAVVKVGGSGLKIDKDMVKQLYAPRTSTGEISLATKFNNRVNAQMQAFDALNKKIQANPGKFVDLKETEILSILQGSSVQSVRDTQKIISNIIDLRIQKDNVLKSKLFANITENTAQDILINPKIFVSSLLDADDITMNTVMKQLDVFAETNPQMFKDLQKAVIMELQERAGKGTGGALVERGVNEMFDPQIMLNILNNKKTGANAKRILNYGTDNIYNDLLDMAKLLKANRSQTFAKNVADLGTKPVVSGQGVTVVASGFVPMLQRFFYGELSANGLTKQLFFTKATAQQKAEAYKQMVSSLLTTNQGHRALIRGSQINTETQKYYLEELENLRKEMMKRNATRN